MDMTNENVAAQETDGWKFEWFSVKEAIGNKPAGGLSAEKKEKLVVVVKKKRAGDHVISVSA